MDRRVEGHAHLVDLLRAEFLERLVEGRGDGTCVEIKFTRDCRVDLPAIFMISARRRGGARSSPLDGARTAAPSPRNNLVKNSTQDGTRVPIYNFLDALARISARLLRDNGPIEVVDRAQELI